MATEVGRGLCRGTKSEAFHEIATNHRIDGTDVHLAGMLRVDACFHIVFNEGLGNPYNEFHALHVLQSFEEEFDLSLAFRKLRRTMVVPELLIAHAGRTFFLHITTNLELAIGNRCKLKILVTDRALHLCFLNEGSQHQLHNHLVVRHYALSCGQSLKVLHDVHLLYKVHIASSRNGQMRPTKLI